MTKQELTYWVALALMPTIWTRRKNELYVNCFNLNPPKTIIDLFEDSSFWNEIGVSADEAEALNAAHGQLANCSFMVEDLLSQGYEIIPIHSDDYPKTLKMNLGKKAPTVLFVKGNKALLQEPSVAIVGSRKAAEISLRFTDNIARKASALGQVVVSGFAKGVDMQALDSALEAGGRSIIVLPQGILTFASGLKQYYKSIVQGNLLVMSTFAPTAPWSKEFAMARNPIIYGMAEEIYVAQSEEKGGTWSGVIDGLRKNRVINVRWPEAEETNANRQLVQKGAQAVDLQGNRVELSADDLKTNEQKEAEQLHRKIIDILSAVSEISPKDMLARLGIDWSDAKMKKYLETIPEVEKCRIKNKVYYRLKNSQAGTLSLCFE